ncbi:gpFI [Symbiodinium microadriaticum]|nr:gpFI [Symbiodinium microadriaticum]
MPEQFLHGVDVVEIDDGVRPIRTVRASVIGLVGTAPDADADAFPLNIPVLVAGNRTEAAKLDTTGNGLGTLPWSMDAIFDQAGAVVVVIRVEEGNDDAETLANVIGGVDATTGAYEGVQALLAAQSVVHVTPRILIAPGFAHETALVSELLGIADRLRAVIIADGPNTNDADAISYRDEFGSPRVYLVDPAVRVFDTVSATEVTQPASPRVAGVIARTDAERGFWHSPSNKEIYGIVGTARPVDFTLGDGNARANLLNEQEVTTIIQEEGYRLWGNRTCGSDPKWAFLNVRRTADMINDSILRAHMWAVDRNINRTYLEDVVEGVNAYIRHLKAIGAIINGEAWAPAELNTPTQIAQGKVYISFKFSANYPAEHITFNSLLVNDYLTEVLPTVDDFVQPKLTTKMTDYVAGGMAGPIEVPMMQLDKLEVSMTLKTYHPDVFKLFNIGLGSAVPMTARGAFQDDDGSTHAVAVTMQMQLREIDPGTWKAGDETSLKLAGSCRSYKLEIDNEVIIEANMITGDLTVGGKDITGYRWQSAARIGRTPAQHYTGPDAMTMQLSGLILSVLPDGADGVTALSFERRRLQLEQMRDEAGKGTPLPMVDGTGRNWGRWVITNVNEDQQSFFADGKVKLMHYRTKDKDMLDQICLTYYGAETAIYDVLEANPFLGDREAVLESGIVIELPGGIAPDDDVSRFGLWLYLIADRLLSLSISDQAGLESDRCSLEIDNRDNAVILPPPGGVLDISLGYDWPDAGIAFHKMGRFTVDEFTLSGPPQTLSVNGQSVDMLGSARGQKTRYWDDVYLAAIVEEIAEDHGLTPRVDQAAREKFYPHLDQRRESDLNFLQRLGQEADLLVTVKEDHLIAISNSEGKTASGADLPGITLTPGDISRYSVTKQNRHVFKGVTTYWRDRNANETKSFTAGDEAGPILQVTGNQRDEKSAQDVAQAELKSRNRNTDGLSLQMPGLPQLVAETPLQLENFPEGVAGPWIAKSVDHKLSSSGFSTAVKEPKMTDTSYDRAAEHTDRCDLTLEKPFEFQGQMITSLSLREPTAADLERSMKEKNGISEGIMTIAHLAEVSPDLVRAMHGRDFMMVNDWVKQSLGVSMG